MADRIEQAAVSLEEYSKSRDINVLEKAVEALEETDLWSIDPAQRLQARRRLLLNWSRALVAIASVKELGFDPDADAPSTRVPPPDGYPPGVAPETIKDPQVRARYEASIADSEKKKAHYRTQLLAAELDERAVESAHRVVDRWYTKSAADQAEIEAVFQEANLSAARRAEVFNPPVKPTPTPPPVQDED